MNENVYFRAWLANTVYAISGIWTLDWCGSQRKCPLTFEEIRMAACQEAFDRKFDSQYRESMRVTQLAATHKAYFH